MSFSHIDGKRLVVFHQFTKHVDRRNEILVVVFDAPQSCNMADRSQSGSADTTDPLGKHIRHREDLIALLIQQQMIVAKMWAADMLVKILRLEIKGKCISHQRVEAGCDCIDRLGR